MALAGVLIQPLQRFSHNAHSLLARIEPATARMIGTRNVTALNCSRAWARLVLGVIRK
jgi:hypothetical protein